MARPCRQRRIMRFPDHWLFSAEDSEKKDDGNIMTLDEYEAVRLIDYEGLTQEQCAEYMNVGRTTVTAIYDSARRKLASLIVDGKRLRISGGVYVVTSGKNSVMEKKGEETMRIAVTYEDGQVFQHFGHTRTFKLYDVNEGKIVGEQIIESDGPGHGYLAGVLKEAQADLLICGGIGMGARNALAEAGIELFAGVSGMPMQQYGLILMVNCRVILTVSVTIMIIRVITTAIMRMGNVITVMMRKAAIVINCLSVH